MNAPSAVPPPTTHASASRPARDRRLEPGLLIALIWLGLIVLLALCAPILPLQSRDEGDLIGALTLPGRAWATTGLSVPLLHPGTGAMWRLRRCA